MFKYLIVFLLVGSASHAQQEQLKTHCRRIAQMLEGGGCLHLAYSLAVVERDGTSDTIQMNLYKDNQNQHLVMGTSQEIFQEGQLLAVVNHESKMVNINKDTAGVQIAAGIAEGILMYIDSASNVVKSHEKGLEMYKLIYHSANIPYEFITLVFSDKSGDMRSMKADFRKDLEGTHSYIQANYRQWDTKWKPEEGFPHLEKYLIKKEVGFQLNEAISGYQFFQPEKGTLKF